MHAARRLVTVAVFTLFAIYVAMLGALAVFQRKLQYFPDTARIEPAAAGFAGAASLTLTTPDGETIVAWQKPAEAGKPVILYFHGNGGNLANRAERFAALTATGFGLLAIDFRGYGGSTGVPSETGLIIDGETAYRHLVDKGVSPRQIATFGESIGSGVAVALAATHKAGALVMEAGYSSTADIAASIYWMFPVRLLMRDQFHSDARIGAVSAPILMLHGERDGVVPIRFGEKLFALAPEPKAFRKISGAGHQVLHLPGMTRQVLDWIGQTVKIE